MYAESEDLEEECEKKITVNDNLSQENLKFPYKMHPIFSTKHYVILFLRAHHKIHQKYSNLLLLLLKNNKDLHGISY